MDNPEKLATLDTQDEEKTQQNMCWTPLYTNKHKCPPVVVVIGTELQVDVNLNYRMIVATMATCCGDRHPITYNYHMIWPT